MKILKYFLFLLLIGIIGFSIYIAVQPNSFEVSRTRTINAPSEVIYDNVIDFKNWAAWSSWVEANPDMKISYSDQTKGVNGAYFWEDKDGVGTMKTIEATPYSFIKEDMQIAEYPKSEVTWTFKSNKDNSTDVTWNISGKNLPFMFKMFTVIMGGMEKQIGPHYERSLEKLDSIVVADMKKHTLNVDGITDHSGGYYLYNTSSCKINELSSTMQNMLPKVIDYAKKNNITMAGAPFVIYHKWDEENNAVMFSCCVPTNSRVITTENEILTGELQPFKAVKTTLKGDYINLKEAWETTMKYIPEHQLEYDETGPMIETYIAGPSKTSNPANWITEIYIAVK